jgi:SAM-dependent methyltransferase
MLDGELFRAPISNAPGRVLDVGTGTGIWAMDFADEYPNAEVIGIDLSPIQPSWVPTNCKFLVVSCPSFLTLSNDVARRLFQSERVIDIRTDTRPTKGIGYNSCNSHIFRLVLVKITAPFRYMLMRGDRTMLKVIGSTHPMKPLTTSTGGA